MSPIANCDIYIYLGFCDLYLLNGTMRNNRLLATICEAYQSSVPHLAEVIRFVSELIEYHLTAENSVYQDSAFCACQNLYSLTVPWRRSVAGLVAIPFSRYLREEPQSESAPSTPRIDAMLTLLASSLGQLSSLGKNAVHACIAYQYWAQSLPRLQSVKGAALSLWLCRSPILASYFRQPRRRICIECLCLLRCNHRHVENPRLLSLLRDSTGHPDLIDYVRLCRIFLRIAEDHVVVPTRKHTSRRLAEFRTHAFIDESQYFYCRDELFHFMECSALDVRYLSQI
jgi:hypothetical protein